MPRKSAALRLSQAESLYQGYSEAGLADAYQGRFIADMINRFQRNKGLSKKQRDWLDSLIEEGVPTPKGDPVIIAKIETALNFWADNADRNWESGVLNDFKHRLNRGYDLSEKQSALMEKLLVRAGDDVSGANVFAPSEEQLEDLKAMVQLYKGYAPQWRGDRPAVAKAVARVTKFLAGEATIEEYHYNKLYNSMGSKVRKWKSPRFRTGSLGWITLYNEGASTRPSAYSDRGGRFICTAISDAYVDDNGRIVNDWLLHSGAVQTIQQGHIAKR